MRYYLLIALYLLTGSCTAQSSLQTNADDNTLLWEVSGKGLPGPSYLFGTFHLLCRDDIRFSTSFRQAVRSSTEIYMELDMDDPATMLGGLMLMNMKGNKKLKDLYTDEEYKRVAGYFRDSLQVSLTMFQTLKPFFLVAMLYPKMMPCKTTSSVEEEIMKLAGEDKKEIKGLETMAFQASVFDSIPYETQAKELLRSIDSMATSKIFFDSMATAYREQRIKELETLLKNDEFGSAEDEELLLNSRNKNWVEQLKTIMKKEPVFVAVGAGHLLGEMGLIALLRKEGYKLRPIMNK